MVTVTADNIYKQTETTMTDLKQMMNPESPETAYTRLIRLVKFKDDYTFDTEETDEEWYCQQINAAIAAVARQHLIELGAMTDSPTHQYDIAF